LSGALAMNEQRGSLFGEFAHAWLFFATSAQTLNTLFAQSLIWRPAFHTVLLISYKIPLPVPRNFLSMSTGFSAPLLRLLIY
jgi:hypothetical protein